MSDPSVSSSTQSDQLRFYLGEDEFDGQVMLTLQSFLLFDQEISHGLDALECRWSDFSTAHSARQNASANWERV